MKHHETEPHSSTVTAMLLLTDRRWSEGLGRLVRRIEEAGILHAEELDLLAEGFVRADEALYWQVRDDWFSGPGIVVDLEPGGPPPAEETAEVPDGPVVVRREVFPPLRRWGSSRLTRRDPAAWSGLLGRARELGGRGGAALVSGLLDAIDCLAPAVQDLLVDTAVGWPDQVVRLLGLGRLADREGPQAAHERAIGDPSARVRSWADSVLDTAQPAPRGTTAETSRADAGPGDAPPAEQPSLF